MLDNSGCSTDELRCSSDTLFLKSRVLYKEIDMKSKKDIDISNKINVINDTQKGILQELKMLRQNDRPVPKTLENKLNTAFHPDITEFPETPEPPKKSKSKISAFGDYF